MFLVRAVGVGMSAERACCASDGRGYRIGIAPENQEHVFAEFQQVEEAANRRFEGTGLGLAITRRIISLMGGKMWLESELGVGSCFGVSLSLPGADTRTQQPAFPNGITRALLVSDHLISRGIIERQLQSAHVQTMTATQPETATKLARQDAPDIVVLDHDLSEADAVTVLSKLRHVLPACPVVLLCATVTDATQALAHDPNLIALSKPLLWRDLCSALARLQGQDPNSGQPPAKPEDRPAPAQRKLNVLYAEDNATNRLVFGKMVRNLPLDLTLAENGREAVECFMQSPPDLIFMDISMPEMDGREATRRIRQLPGGADIPIIALTAHALREEVAKIMAAGMNATLTKPLRKAVLLEALHKIMRRRVSCSSAGPE